MKKRIIYESTGYWTTETWEDAVNYYKQAYYVNNIYGWK